MNNKWLGQALIGIMVVGVLSGVVLLVSKPNKAYQRKLPVDLGGGVSMTLCWIPAGEFTMGSPDSESGRDGDEGPKHRVTITSGFWMGKYEVTQRQYQQIMGDNPSNFKNAGPDAPVEQVDWNQAKAFCERLQARLPASMRGKTARLPTEAEWEYACRAGTCTAFHCGSDLDSAMANFDGNSPYGNSSKGVYRHATVKAGSFRPNAWGLHDMHGNVWEWCWDSKRGYTASAQRDPEGAGSSRVIRGGSWSDFAWDCRSASRNDYAPGDRYNYIGLRVVVRDPGMVTAPTDMQVAAQRPEARGPVPGRDWRSPSTGMEFVWIEALKIWVGKYEVTNGEYRKMARDHDSESYEGRSLNGDRQPVVYVNFDDGKKFAEWMTAQDRGVLGGARYRHPSEQEFMVYAQCGRNWEYPWGNESPPRSGQAGNYADETAKRVFKSVWTPIELGYDDGHAVPCDVEKSLANPWNLFGVGGNVWEACASDNTGGLFGAWRGASWYDYSPDRLRCASRLDFGGATRDDDGGFRLVLVR